MTVLALALSTWALSPGPVSAQVELTTAVDYGGGRYGVIASVFGTPTDGLVGNMTSSGEILKANDRLVALPACTESSCPWLERGTDKSDPYGPQTSCAESDGYCWVAIYVPETGRCAVAPVLDRGPLFVMDNWWAATENRVYPLPKGQPASEVVRSGGTVGFGDGYSDRGYNVQRDYSFGPAIDLAAGTWVDLGLSHQRMAANVEVTLLWQAGISHHDACNGSTAPSNASTTDDVNFRSGPATTHDVLDVLAAGTRVLVTGGARNGFYPVEIDGTSGWVFGEYLAPDDGAAADRMATATDELNFRAGPTLSDEIMGVLPVGSLVVLTGESSGGFLSVSFRGRDGWAHADYLDLGDGISGQQPTTNDGTATVLEALNLRAGPSTADDILEVMPAGTAVTLTGDSQAGFVSVEVAGESGWAYAIYLEADGQALADETTAVLEDLNLRAGPSTSDEILDIMPSGATVTLTGNGANGFVSVIYQGTEGWAQENYLN